MITYLLVFDEVWVHLLHEEWNELNDGRGYYLRELDTYLTGLHNMIIFVKEFSRPGWLFCGLYELESSILG